MALTLTCHRSAVLAVRRKHAMESDQVNLGLCIKAASRAFTPI